MYHSYQFNIVIEIIIATFKVQLTSDSKVKVTFFAVFSSSSSSFLVIFVDYCQSDINFIRLISVRLNYLKASKEQITTIR